MRFLFGDCVFDTEARRLTRAGQPVPLAPKPLVLLECLLRRRPAVVPQQELRDVLWPRTFVGYNNLGQVVAELRRALADREQRLVRTAYGAGYAIDAAVLEEEPPPAEAGAPPTCFLRWGSLEIPLHEGVNVLGRGLGCDCRIASRHVSREHARIVVRGRSARLEDLGSKNGTRVRGRRVDGPTALVDSDEVLIGREPLVFCAAGSWDTTASYEQPGPTTVGSALGSRRSRA